MYKSQRLYQKQIKMKKLFWTISMCLFFSNGLFATTIFETYPWLTDIVQQDNCISEKVEVYEISIFTYLLVTDTDGVATLYNQDGLYYCQSASNFDCIALYNLEGPIDSWDCAANQESSCSITITNTQCRGVGVYDEHDNFITSMVSGPHPFGPPNQASSIWEDPRPLGVDEDRVYIFKENNFVLGSQTVSCANTQITVSSKYFNGCTDALGIAEITNTGCRTIEVHNTRSEVVSTHEPGETFYLTAGPSIHILMAGLDTLGINANAYGDYDLNSGGCEEEGNPPSSTIPENFEDYYVIYTLCKGDTLSVPNPVRTIQCPAPPPGPGIIENFPFLQVPDWTSSTGANFSVSFSPGASELHLFPTETTMYEGDYNPFSCGGPAGPLGLPIKYLVLVEDSENCGSNGQPNFVIEACAGDIIELPSPNQVGSIRRTICDDFIELAGGSVAELVEENGTSMKVRIKDAGKFSVNGIGGRIESIYNRATVQSSCPVTSYQFEVKLKADCSETGGNAALFEDYPWLNNLVNLNDCSTESVELYQTSIFFYLLVKDATGKETLYNANGQFYCQHSPNFDCVAAYDLGSPIDSWSCGDTPPVGECGANTGTFFFRACDDGQIFYFIGLEDGTIYDPYFAEGISFDVIDGQRVKFDYVDANFASPCSIAEKAITITCLEALDFPINNGDCSKNSGEIVVTQCDDGTDFYFIESTIDGLLYDAYFAEGIDFVKYHGQKVNFDFELAGFDSPCSIADDAIIVTCIEERVTELVEYPAIFSRFDWLEDLVDPFDCEGQTETLIAVYQQSIFNFILVQENGNRRLYFEDGTFYCQDSDNFDCVSAYSLGSPIDFWSCSGRGLVELSERTNGAAQTSNLTLFPNPVSTNLTVQLPTTIQENQQLRIFDTFGRTVLEKRVTSSANTLEVDVASFQNGLYYLVLFGNGKKLVQKFVKQDLK